MRTPSAVLAGALVAVVATSAGAAFASRPAPACAVAVVDLSRAYAAHARAMKLNETLRAQEEQIKARIQTEEGKLRKEIQDLEVRFAPGSEEYEKGRKDIQMKYAPIAYDLDREKMRLARSQVQGMTAAYREVVTEAERIAGERGYTCVLNYDPEQIVIEQDGKLLHPDAVSKQMIDRTTLWASGTVDLTTDVIEALAKK